MKNPLTALKKNRQGVSAFLLALFLAIQALAIFPSLHEAIHPDAGDADHECAVTLLSHGQVETSATPPIVFLAPTVFVYAQFATVAVGVSTDLRLLPGRGPPVELIFA